MIRMSKQADYGLVLMTQFVRSVERKRNLSARELARQTRLPLPMVSKVLKALAREGLLLSHGARAADTAWLGSRSTSPLRKCSRRWKVRSRSRSVWTDGGRMPAAEGMPSQDQLGASELRNQECSGCHHSSGHDRTTSRTAG